MEEKNCVGKLLFLILILSLMNFEVFSRKEKFFRLFLHLVLFLSNTFLPPIYSLRLMQNFSFNGFH